MKGVFVYLTALTMALSFFSCTEFSTIPRAEFTFVNNRTDSAVTVTPLAGEDWSALTIALGSSDSVQSENSAILFTAATAGGTAIELNEHYMTYDSTGRTYTFTDYVP